MGVRIPPSAHYVRIKNMDIKKKIEVMIASSLKEMGVEYDVIEVEEPRIEGNGDFSSNIAMRLSSALKRNPLDIANDIVSKISEDVDIEKIEAVKPGFINFFVSSQHLLKELSKVKSGEFSKIGGKEDKKIVIEYTDANPFKILHIGHLYTNVVGESFARLSEALGATVKRANYQGDVGLHVAKTLWGIIKKMSEEGRSFEDIEKKSLVDRVKYLGDAYMLGFQYYDDEKDEDAIKEIDAINYYIFSMFVSQLEKKEAPQYEGIDLKDIYQKGRLWCLDYFETIYDRVGTSFDYYFFESEVGESGLKVVLDNVGSVFKEDDGAIIYEGDKEKGLHTRVFVNKYGIPTYEAKDLGLAIKKDELVDYDESIIITGNEQAGYFKVLFDALGKVRKDLAGKTRHISHGMVRLPGAEKMSSRKGKIIEAQWLLDETKKRVLAVMEENGKGEKDETAEKISQAAIKYAFLKVGVGKDVVFDFEKSISFDGDTGPYLLYVYARGNSILKDSGCKDLGSLCLGSCLANPYTKELLAHIGKYGGVVLNSGMSYSPSILCQYLFDLGQKFNNFYQNVRVLDAQDDDKVFLLSVVEATMITMKDGLNLLGIEVVEQM